MNDRKSRAENYSLILLAGGKSSRMGSNKAELTFQGKTFTDLLIEKARMLGIEKIYLSGFEKADADVQVVWDIYPERGPLGGVHACLNEMDTPYALVLPVDVPQIPVSVLEQLISGHETHFMEEKEVPFLLKHGERQENLIGIYPAEMVDFIEEEIKERSAAVHRMLKSYGTVWFEVDVPQWQVDNLNTRENYEHLLEMEQRGLETC